jgi:uncharacterized protein YkwD
MSSHAKKQFHHLPRLAVIVVVLTLMMTASTFFTSLTSHAAAKAHSANASGLLGKLCGSRLETYTFNLINSSRRSAGLLPYRCGRLFSVTRAHSALNLATGEDGCPNVHQCPGEDDPGTRITKAGVTYSSRAENVGYWKAFPTLDLLEGQRNIHQFFMNEGPGGGHYDNIMSPTLTYLNVGIACDKNHIWVTEDFITP